MVLVNLARHCLLDPAGRALPEAATENLGLSPPAPWTPSSGVARTIADLAGTGPCRAAHLAEAIQYRSLDVVAPGELATAGGRAL